MAYVEPPTGALRLTPTQRVLLRALDEERRTIGAEPAAIGRSMSALYERGLVVTNAMYIHNKSFADLRGFSMTKKGREALGASRG
jgi:hypothetical protein